jgi:hypothetical protein
METITRLENKEIEITAVTFRNNPTLERFESYPQRMLYEGREYTFTESGIRFLIKKGQQLVRLFDVSDGENQYRLRQDEDNRWTLVNKKVLA